jgi:hypothetical protein
VSQLSLEKKEAALAKAQNTKGWHGLIYRALLFGDLADLARIIFGASGFRVRKISS